MKFDRNSDEETKEVYAYFGLAAYWASVLEHGIVNALCFLEIFPKRQHCINTQEWEALIDLHYNESFELTLGKLKKQLTKHLPSLSEGKVIIADLDKCLNTRNFLIHHFFREKASLWFSIKGREEMIEYLDEAVNLFRTADKKLDTIIKPISKKYGLTEDILEKLFADMQFKAEAYS